MDEVMATLKNLLKLIGEDVTPSHWDKHAKGLLSNLLQLPEIYNNEVSDMYLCNIIRCLRIAKIILLNN